MVLSDDAHRAALAVAPKVSGSLSLVGSAMIIRDVLRRRKRRRSTDPECDDPNHNHNHNNRSSRRLPRLDRHLPMTSRIILTMSVADIGSSFWAHLLGTWMAPKASGDPRAIYAVGNEATCALQGFFYELSIYSGLWSNALLAIAYWLTVCRGIRESTLRQWKWQFLLLGLPWIVGLASAVPKAILSEARFNGYWWCELAEGSPTADDLLDQVLVVTCFILIMSSMAALMRFVYVRERRLDQFSFNSSQSDERQRRHREKTMQVTYQGLFFILEWMVIVVPTVMITLVDDLPRGYLVFWACLFPSQGLGNTLVYFRPKYVALRRQEEKDGDARRGGVAISASAAARALDLSLPDSVTRLASSLRESFWSNGRVNVDDEVGDSGLRVVRESRSKRFDDGEERPSGHTDEGTGDGSDGGDDPEAGSL